MTKHERIIEAQLAAGWNGQSFEPMPSSCKACGEAIPPTTRRGNAFGGRGCAREFCEARCRKRWSRAKSSSRKRRERPLATRRASTSRHDV